MNGLLVARQILRRSYRNREAPAIVVLFAVVFGGLGAVYGQLVGPAGFDTAEFLRFPILVASVLVPVVGLVLGNTLVAGPRGDGRLRLLFGQPVSRRAFVLGGYLAKALVLLVAVIAGVLAMLAVAAGLEFPLAAGQILPFFALTFAVGLAYLGMAVAISAQLRSTAWTTFTAFGAFLVFVGFWRLLPTGIAFVLNDFTLPMSGAAWMDIGEALSPSVAYEMVLILEMGATTLPTQPAVVTDTAVYLGLLALWIVLIPAVSIWWFARTDL